MAVFGAPVAYGDDPERAVRAAVAIREAVHELNEADPDLDLQMRIAVNTGEALVTLSASAAHGEGMVTGDVVNTASRLQEAAPVNGILVGEETFRATRSAIDYEEAGEVVAKGKQLPVRVWRALAPTLSPGERRRGKVPMLGRASELGVLVGIWENVVSEKRPQLVTLFGPARDREVAPGRRVRRSHRRSRGAGDSRPVAALRRGHALRRLCRTGEAGGGHVRHRHGRHGERKAERCDGCARRRGCRRARGPHRDADRRRQGRRRRRSTDAVLRRATARGGARSRSADGARLRRHPRLGVEHARPARDTCVAGARRSPHAPDARASRALRRAAHVGKRPPRLCRTSTRASRRGSLRGARQTPARRGGCRCENCERARSESGREPALHRRVGNVSRRGPLQRGRASLEHSRDHRREARHAASGRARGRARRVGVRQGLLVRSPDEQRRGPRRPDSKRSTHSRVAT